MTTLRLENLHVPGSLPAENPFPVFRDRNPHRAVPFESSVEPRYRKLAGWNTGARMLPYRVQDRYDRAGRPQTLPAIVLENDRLRATFLPTQGGRLWSLYHKRRERELLARNTVFQPANLAIRNAWFAGGIEWNVGQYGHSALTCAPVFASEIRQADGSPTLRLHEFERTKRLFWQTDLSLPPGSEFLIAHTRVLNAFAEEASMYWWTNIAVPEAPGVRVIAPAAQALFVTPRRGFGQATLPQLPSLDGRDGTYAVNASFANEVFMQCEAAPHPFVAALDRAGTGFVEASTARLTVRKLFCWGMHAGGRHWQDFLSPAGPYIEIQAGLAPTQLHGAVLPPHTAWDWTEVFGYLEADPRAVHSHDWCVATAAVEAALNARMPAAQLARINAGCRAQVDRPAIRILQPGAGWGALERRRRAARGAPPVPPAFAFPDATLAGEPERWLPLLKGGVLPPAAEPGEWMVQSEWRDELAASLTRPGGGHWQSWLHYGVMLYEASDDAGAERAWLESLALQPSVWVWRNLAVLAQTRRDFAAAQRHYEQAWRLTPSLGEADRIALAREIMRALVAWGDARATAAFFAILPPSHQADEGVQIARAQAAMALGELDAVEDVLQREFVTIREGDVTLTDLWFELWARREAAGGSVTAEHRRLAGERHPAPARIDFRGLPS